jgi:hypothetical protein
MNSQQFDVYVNYCPDDEGWVYDTLVPLLQTRKLTYTDQYQYVGGRPEIEEIVRSIKGSHRTILIITPEYLKSTWGHFSAMLVGAFGRETNRWLAVPLIARDGVEELLPLEIKMLTAINVMAGGERAWEQLFTTLRESPEPPPLADYADFSRTARPTAARGQSAISAGLRALLDLMQKDEVKRAAADYRAEFQTAHDQIQILTDYKDMHDELHDMKTESFQPLCNALEQFPRQERARDMVGNARFDLARNVQNVQDVLTQPAFANSINSWVDKLEKALEELNRAHDQGDWDALNRAVRYIDLVIADQPPKINVQLVEAARKLGFAKLVYAMTRVREHLSESDVDRGRATLFEGAIHNLADLYHRLTELIAEHDRWQQIDSDLRLIRNDSSLDTLMLTWEVLRGMAEPVYRGRAEPWARSLASVVERLDRAVADKNVKEAREPFQQFYGHASNRFIQVDKALRKLSTDLREVGQLLSFVLEVIG